MKLGTVLAFSTLLLAAEDPQFPPPCYVTAVHHSSSTEMTRLTIETSGRFLYRAGRLHNPERAYFDILNSQPRLSSQGPYVGPGDPLVHQIRIAEAAPGVTRVILSLTGQVAVASSPLTNPYRLVIELRRGSAGTTPSPSVSSVMSAANSTEESSRRPGSEGVGEAAKRGDSSLTRALGLKVRRVVIDPGHGGSDPGTRGARGLREKDLVLDIALRVGNLVKERTGWDVLYTRIDDSYFSLEGRTDFANAKKADLFLSIHANSSLRPESFGVETFYLNITANRDDLAVASRENANSQKSVSEGRDIIERISRYDKVEESREFAGYIQSALVESCESRGQEGDRGVKTAPFIVLLGAEMPAVLAEVGFLSNSREETLLNTLAYRQKVAEALYRGMDRYARSLSHFPNDGKP
jgi:N-acetylmuramoyl-L-alanine amidase